MANGWLSIEHPVYKERKAEWKKMERRLRAGSAILEELRPFDWESGQVYGLDPASRKNERAAQDIVAAKVMAKEAGLTVALQNHYEARQSEATYINFPQAFASMVIGHIFAKAPKADHDLDFGNLGKVTRATDAVAPSRAELLYYDTDGSGHQGTTWDVFWKSVAENSMATGFRWVMVEAPRTKGPMFDAEITGLRPYLISYSPLAVTNWFDQDGKLQFAILTRRYRDPQLNGDRMSGNEWLTGKRLMTAAGCERFGKDYAGGGWFDFDKSGERVDGAEGDWAMTDGEIPMWMHFYMRDDQDVARSGLLEISQAAIAYMNVDSAANYDFWDACASLMFILGVDKTGFNLAMSKLRLGSRYIPVPQSKNGGVPTVQNGSLGAIPGDVADKRLERIRTSIREVATLEASGSPDASGMSKIVGFKEAKSPRLLNLAAEMESSQTTAIFFLEKRNGFRNPIGGVKWPREYDLAPLMQKLMDYLDAQDKAGVSSPTLTARALQRAAQECGLTIDDADGEAILAELLASIEGKANADAQRTAMLADFIPGGGGGGPAPPNSPAPLPGGQPIPAIPDPAE